MSQRSEQINELAEALSKAQGQIKGALKDSANPFFKSKYADLSSVWEACRKPLSDNGLAIVQSPSRLLPLPVDGRTCWMVEVETLLTHKSGQWIAEVSSTPIDKVDAQGVGSATTYLRRYALAAFAGVAPEDDDGNAAVGGPSPKPVERLKVPHGYEEWLLDLQASGDEGGSPALEAAWKASSQDNRAYLTATNPKLWADIKAKAAKVRVQ